jgi:Mg2+-importing ATPase
MLPGFWLSRRLLGRDRTGAPGPDLEAYWALEPAELFRRLRSGPEGLSSGEALERLKRYGPNELRQQRPLSRLRVLGNQLRSPLLLLLLFAAAVSTFTGQWTEATIVLVIVLASVAVGYRREYSAQATAAALQGRVKTRTTVLRDGQPRQIPVAQVVPETWRCCPPAA